MMNSSQPAVDPTLGDPRPFSGICKQPHEGVHINIQKFIHGEPQTKD